MNRYWMIRRLRGPAFLLLAGALALLNQMNILSWGKSWPLFLILAGVLQLAERALLAADGGYPPPQYPPAQYPTAPYAGAPYPDASAPTSGAVDPRTATGVPAYPGQPEAYIAPRQQDGKTPEGGQS